MTDTPKPQQPKLEISKVFGTTEKLGPEVIGIINELEYKITSQQAKIEELEARDMVCYIDPNSSKAMLEHNLAQENIDLKSRIKDLELELEDLRYSQIEKEENE